MGLWTSIRRMWARHDERLAEEGLERESLGVHPLGVADVSAFVQEAANLTPNELGAVEGEAD